MTDYDLIIIGGGPAGSSLAWALEGSDKSVLLIDKACFPRDKTCAGWVTPAVLEALDVDTDAYGRDNVFQPIHRFRIGMMGQAAVENDHGGAPVSYGIRRCEFDAWLLERTACDKALGEAVKTIRRDGDGWCVNGRYRAPLVVGAGGHFCPVARQIGRGPGRHETAVTAKEVEFQLPPEEAADCPVPPEQPELWFCRDLKGYAWVFRKGDWLNVGLGREDNHKLGEHLDAFVDEMRAAGRLPEKIDGRYKGHAYLLYDHARRPVVGDGLMLIGDAAGLAYTQSGEGIRTAVESALLAARVIREKAPLAAYEAALEQRFGKRRGEGDGWLPAGLKTGLARLLMRTHWFTRNVVTERWFLHSHVPALRPAVARSES